MSTTETQIVAAVKEAQRKPALSISAVDMLSKCGEQYYRRYIQKERIAPGVASIVGRGVDGAVNANLTHKMETRELLPLEKVLDLARDAFESEWKSQEVALSKDEVADGVQNVKGRAVDKAVRLAKLHASDLAPVISPTAVQRKWTIELPGYPMDLIGYTDIEEGPSVIRDTKTSHKSPREDEADLSDQLTLYALAKRVLDKTKGPIAVVLDYLVDLKTPKVVTRDSERTIDDFRVMLRRIEVAQRAIDAGVFVPARQSDWWCSPRWCGYFNSCPYARQRKQVFISGENQNG